MDKTMPINLYQQQVQAPAAAQSLPVSSSSLFFWKQIVASFFAMNHPCSELSWHWTIWCISHPAPKEPMNFSSRSEAKSGWEGSGDKSEKHLSSRAKLRASVDPCEANVHFRAPTTINVNWQHSHQLDDIFMFGFPIDKTLFSRFAVVMDMN